MVEFVTDVQKARKELWLLPYTQDRYKVSGGYVRQFEAIMRQEGMSQEDATVLLAYHLAQLVDQIMEAEVATLNLNTRPLYLCAGCSASLKILSKEG